MRAYIKDSSKDIGTVKKEWLQDNTDSFHGVISDTRDSFIFMDSRLPDGLELPLCEVELDQ